MLIKVTVIGASTTRFSDAAQLGQGRRNEPKDAQVAPSILLKGAHALLLMLERGHQCDDPLLLASPQ
jgi:hypothetical protein